VSASAYHFEDHWKIPFPIEAVFDVLATPVKFPGWWQGVYLKATALDPAARHIAVLTKGWLPYKLRWTIETIRMEKPNLIEFKASGDFETDLSRWILRREGKGTLVTLDWNPKVEKPIVKLLSPVLKPVFEWNHHWAMNRGEKQLTEYLSRG
jgi:hypothetical protein